MQCQNCKEHIATIHLTEITDGHRQETHLCQLCAQKEGLAIKSQIPLNELLSTLLAAQSESVDEPQSSEETVMGMEACPSCGMTLNRFRKESLLGCPNDYDVFDKQLSIIIEKSHNGNTCHCGKVPAKTPAEGKKQIDLMALRKQLDEAVKFEDYEKAATIRDEIGRLQ